MAKLENPKHEAFAQYFSQGKSAAEAYEKAGYKANRGNAVRLSNDERILKRVDELQERRAAQQDITVASITKMLMKVHEKALLNDDRPDLTNARQSAMDMAKLHGLMVDKSKIEADVSVSRIERVIVDSKD